MGNIKNDNKTDASSDTQKSLLSIGIFIFIGIIAVISGRFLYQWLNAPGQFPIQKIELVNQLEYQQSNVLRKAAANALDGGFFSMNVDVFREKILLLPWVKNVSVRKVWPNKLLISIRERTPVVRWMSVDENTMIKQSREPKQEHITQQNALLSEEGIIFKPELTREQQATFSKRPLFIGPDKSTAKVLSQCLQFIQEVKPINSNIERCGMDARHAWTIKLTSGLVLNLGKHDVLKHLNRFVNTFSQQLDQYLQYVVYADLRYSNGFSVKWLKETADKTDDVRLN